MITVDDVRSIVAELDRAYEVFVRGHIKFRVGQIVFAAFSKDEQQLGFGFPRELREGLVNSEPHKFLMPSAGDMRYQWVVVRLDAIGFDELRELVEEAWAMTVPKKVSEPYFEKALEERPPRT